jgi:hypothetical protein
MSIVDRQKARVRRRERDSNRRAWPKGFVLWIAVRPVGRGIRGGRPRHVRWFVKRESRDMIGIVGQGIAVGPTAEREFIMIIKRPKRRA